jgi:hypothetical protein
VIADKERQAIDGSCHVRRLNSMPHSYGRKLATPGGVLFFVFRDTSREHALLEGSPFPRVPRFLWRAGKRLAVSFENGDVMALPSQQHRHRKPDNTAA